MFESTPAQPDKTINLGSYPQALYGLHHDRGVAENIFTACAKRHLVKILKDIPILRLPKDVELEVFPLWVDQQSLAIRLKDLPTSPKDKGFIEAAQPLESMVIRLANNVRNTWAEQYEQQRLVLVESLGVKVQDIGGGIFAFSAKQKWGFRDE